VRTLISLARLLGALPKREVLQQVLLKEMGSAIGDGIRKGRVRLRVDIFGPEEMDVRPASQDVVEIRGGLSGWKSP
jgi:hypothetical protein